MSTFVFTNWDPTVYPNLPGDALLVHMAVAALRYRTVLIRDQDLTFNRPIAEVFVAAENQLYRNLLEELLQTGVFAVNKMRLENYADNALAEEAIHSPIRARAKFVAAQSSYCGVPFNPDEGPLPQFHALMDDLLRRHPNAQKYQPADANIPPTFRAEFIAACQECKADLRDHPAFGSISPRTLDELVELVSDPSKAVAYLRDCGRPLVGSAESPRSLLYQIVDTERYRADETSIRRLAQSLFAAVYCASEQADGLYSDLLSEPPYPASLSEADSAGGANFSGVRLSPLGSLELRPGIGGAISEIRENLAYNHYLACVCDTFDTALLRSTWEYYAQVFARLYSRKLKLSQCAAVAQALAFLSVSSGVALGVTFGLEQSGFHSAATTSEAVGGGLTALGSVATILDCLSRGWRNRHTRRTLTEAVTTALRFRYHRVPLIAAHAGPAE